MCRYDNTVVLMLFILLRNVSPFAENNVVHLIYFFKVFNTENVQILNHDNFFLALVRVFSCL